MADDRGEEPSGELRGNLPPGSGMTGPFGQRPGNWQRSPTPQGMVAVAVLVVIVVVVVIVLAS